MMMMMMDDGDKLFLTAQTLSAKVGFHKGRVKQQYKKFKNSKE
jgi:hypothetical protein